MTAAEPPRRSTKQSNTTRGFTAVASTAHSPLPGQSQAAVPAASKSTPARSAGAASASDSESDCEVEFISANAPSLPGSAVAEPATLAPTSRAHVLPRSGPSGTGRTPFDLTAFLCQFDRGQPAALTPARPAAGGPAASSLERVQATASAGGLEHPGHSDPLVARLIAQLAQALNNETRTDRPTPTTTWTLPNARGAIPPAAIRELRAERFPPTATRSRGDFAPAQLYILAAHRLYPRLLSPEGLHETPLSCVLRWRVVSTMTFVDSTPILIALYSARFGRFGVSIMHFRRADREAVLEAGSSDANFALDFGRHAAPPAPPLCRSYNDLLSAVQSLMSFANAQWYPEIAQALYRVREFVMSNMDADPSNSSRRVQRTLHEVNQLLGAAFVHLSSDSPFWWREFSAAVARIDYMSPTWAMALHELAVTPVRPVVGPRSSTPANRAPAAHPSARSVFRQPATRNPRPGSIPAHIRQRLVNDVVDDRVVEEHVRFERLHLVRITST